VKSRPLAPTDITGAQAGYAAAFRDWLACAVAGRGHPAAAAARGAGEGLLERVAAAGAAGHVLDFDDTYLPGLAHLSAAAAPAVLVLGAELGASVDRVLDAYAAGFEAMGALTAASHPALYDGGWHPTAVCGPVGAAVASTRLLELDPVAERSAVALALLRTGGLRAGFGTHGKSLAVGIAAAAGVQSALLAAEGASVPLEAAVAGFEHGFGGRYAEPDGEPAVAENWIKAYPCCLQTHGPIEVTDLARGDRLRPGEPLTVVVNPVSLKAAPFGRPEDGLQAKFSIPYLTGFTLLHGPPRVESFEGVDAEAAALGESRVRIETDPQLRESEARLLGPDGELARVEAALGSPWRPMTGQQLEAKIRDLAGERLAGALDDLERPARELLRPLEAHG
jgi:aconitate decarboxylase